MFLSLTPAGSDHHPQHASFGRLHHHRDVHQRDVHTSCLYSAHSNEHLAKSVYNVSRNVWSRYVLQIQSLTNIYKLATFRFVQYGNEN